MLQAKSYKLKAKKGFTLIESLVAIALFVLVITAALGLFLTYSKAQKETGIRLKVINQLSAEMEKVAKDVRLNKLSFSGSANYKTGNLYQDGDATDATSFPIAGKEQDLGFTAGLRYFYIPGGTSPKPAGLSCYGYIDNTQTGTSGYLYRYNGSSNCEPILMISEINLIDIGFYISPNYNSYPAANADCKNNNFNGYYCMGANDSQCGSGAAGSGLHVEGFCYVSQPSVTISITAQIGGDATNVVTLQTTISSRVYQ